MKRGTEKMNKNTGKNIFYKTNPSGGISLIVLVITIIVVIILAAAVIISLQNNNPMVEANKARINSDVANMQAIFTNAVGKIMAENQDVVQIEKGKLYTEITGTNKTRGEATYKIMGADGTVAVEGKIIFGTGEKIDTTTYYTGKELPLYGGDTKWYVDEQGLISVKVDGISYGEGEQIEESTETPEDPVTPPVEPEKPEVPDYKPVTVGEIVTEKAGKYTDADGDVAIIPIDFAIVPGKNDISNGLVISDVENDIEDVGNQFVWIPVNDMSTFRREAGYCSGAIQTSEFNNCSEPLSYNAVTASASETNEYNKMIASVEKNKGFYIGRYEMSKEGSYIESKKNKYPLLNIKWGKSMKDLTGGIVEEARKMYPESVANSGNVVSTLVYGVAWDEIVRFMKKNYPGIESNSTEFGNYTKNIIQTGSNPNYAFNNIYDMAGNAWEWTMEALKDNIRVLRGGRAYDVTGYQFPISSRYVSIKSTYAEATLGGRVQLYIK